MSATTLHSLLEKWKRDRNFSENVVRWVDRAAIPAEYEPFPGDVSQALTQVLNQRGIDSLYIHQAQAWKLVRASKNVILTTGTASGKSLCYQLPILDALIRNPASHSLLLFPTKGLTQDQLESMGGLIQNLKNNQDECFSDIEIPAAVYDGDTPTSQRQKIRQNARMLFTNPDMLHTAILPHHTIWVDFFKNLEFVVLDEIHIYRGVFGSHIANLIRRLKRIAHFYGSNPVFITTSATIANPLQLASNLFEESFELVEKDGSPHGRNTFLLYNPPIVHPELGIRRSPIQESVKIARELLGYQIQSILFGKTRRTVEMLVRYLQEGNKLSPDALHAYRSGYLPSDRRMIERGLRDGSIRSVAATSALELGIDIGGMEAVILVGYPGTVAATRQQAGRAGRRQGESVAVLVASSGPLDQFLMQHPEYLLDRNSERGLINPDNPLILLHHLRCAAFELPFKDGDQFGRLNPADLADYLQFLSQSGDVFQNRGRFTWMADRYPADLVSLRSTTAERVLIRNQAGDHEITMGQVDFNSALWMVHPEAVYLHEGQTYLVKSLDLETKIAQVQQADVDFYTEPIHQDTITRLNVSKEEEISGAKKFVGEILVTSQVTGFKRLKWFTQENLGASPLDLPSTELRTVGYWIALSSETVDDLRGQALWQNDPNEYGPKWEIIRKMVRRRDNFTCRVCGTVETTQSHQIHHKRPFRSFPSAEQANSLDNLITLCPDCHRKAEAVVKMRSGLAGLRTVLVNLAPLFLMCDVSDLGAYADPQSSLSDGQPTVVVYDQAPAGIGLSQELYDIQNTLLEGAFELVKNCACQDGCPACVGPGGELGSGGKKETLAILSTLLKIK
jgi:DEAD/DEAH box helicase domain-containing protein